MKAKKAYSVSSAVLAKNARGGRATRKSEPRAQVPASRSVAARLCRLVRPMSRREVVDLALTGTLDALEKSEKLMFRPSKTAKPA